MKFVPYISSEMVIYNCCVMFLICKEFLSRVDNAWLYRHDFLFQNIEMLQRYLRQLFEGFFFLKRPFFKMIFKGSLKVFLQGFYHELPQKKIVQKFLHLFFSRLFLMESFRNSSKCCCTVFSLNSIRNFSGTLPEFL